MTELNYGINIKPRFFLTEKGTKTEIVSKSIDNGFTFEHFPLKGGLAFSQNGNSFCYKVEIENISNEPFFPECLALDMGIDTYLDKYPEWNNKFFPSFFRCEKTHFYGYFMGPKENLLGVYLKSPVASYANEYNPTDTKGYGHRIYYTEIDLLCSVSQPNHHAHCTELKAKEKRCYEIYFEQFDDINDWRNSAKKYGIPIIGAEKFTLEKGEKINLNILCEDNYSLELIAPSGKRLTDFTATEYGLYELTLKTEGGLVSTAKFYCRKPYEWYLKNARLEAINKPPHATTHSESWYGFFSGFLAQKHYPDKELDGIIGAMFDEIVPYMFDFEDIGPKLLTERVQNAATLISLLVDRYEADPESNKEYLSLASRFGDWLMTRQKEEGGYYRNEILYTCVIYPAKSMLELTDAEEKEGSEYFKAAAKRHFDSATKAIDNLVDKLEDIETEGEHTLEDGMISCSALQIALYALKLPKEKRQKYIDAAEHMIGVHRCLEQLETPDCRARGGSIRYWEAQYDILFIKNLQTSPHGWSAWLLYALYYLYLLTAKKEYLTLFMDGMGAAIQLMNLEGELRWAFVTDPWILTEEAICPDFDKPIKNAYKSVKTKIPAYEGKFVPAKTGEDYLPMISGWYQTGEGTPVNGGHYWCPLFLENETLEVSHQGGCCDNDVHEIFKCLEETVLKKAFIHQNEDGSLICYNCKAEILGKKLIFSETEPIDRIFACVNEDLELQYKDKRFLCKKGGVYEVFSGLSV